MKRCILALLLLATTALSAGYWGRCSIEDVGHGWGDNSFTVKLLDVSPVPSRDIVCFPDKLSVDSTIAIAVAMTALVNNKVVLCQLDRLELNSNGVYVAKMIGIYLTKEGVEE
jgi:hypothetical protein